jgi:hypothetical protein
LFLVGFVRIPPHDPVAFGSALALVQLAVGVGWLVDRHHGRRWLALGVAVTVLYWLVGQCLGSVLSAGATDVGTGPLLILLCVAGWPRVVAQRTERADEHRTQPIEAADRSTVAAISTVKAIPA